MHERYLFVSSKIASNWFYRFVSNKRITAVEKNDALWSSTCLLFPHDRQKKKNAKRFSRANVFKRGRSVPLSTVLVGTAIFLYSLYYYRILYLQFCTSDTVYAVFSDLTILYNIVCDFGGVKYFFEFLLFEKYRIHKRPLSKGWVSCSCWKQTREELEPGRTWSLLKEKSTTKQCEKRPARMPVV